MYLMLADTRLIRFDFNEYIFELLNGGLLPFIIRGRFCRGNDLKSINSNLCVLKGWLIDRVGSDLNRCLYDYFGLDKNSDSSKLDCCLKYHAFSMLDSYWVCRDDEILFYQDIHPRMIDFKTTEKFMFSCKSIGEKCDDSSPELCSHLGEGYTWGRDCLLSYGGISYRVSEILNILEFGFDVLSFELSSIETDKGNITVSKANLFLENDESFVEFGDLLAFYRTSGVKLSSLLSDMDKFFASIQVLDFLVSNDGRTHKNFGCIMDNNTGKLKGFAPVFGFEKALYGNVFENVLKKNIDLVDINLKSDYTTYDIFFQSDVVARNYETYLDYKLR